MYKPVLRRAVVCVRAMEVWYGNNGTSGEDFRELQNRLDDHSMCAPLRTVLPREEDSVRFRGGFLWEGIVE